MSNFKESMYQKKSFIYQIGDAYYAIGADTFVKLSDSAETDSIELLQNALKKNNERQIAKYLDKIIRIASAYRVSAREHYQMQEKLFAFIDELETQDETSFLELQKQAVQFDELFAKYSKMNEV